MSVRATTQLKLGRKFGGVCCGGSRLWKQSQICLFFFLSPNHLPSLLHPSTSCLGVCSSLDGDPMPHSGICCCSWKCEPSKNGRKGEQTVPKEPGQGRGLPKAEGGCRWGPVSVFTLLLPLNVSSWLRGWVGLSEVGIPSGDSRCHDCYSGRD